MSALAQLLMQALSGGPPRMSPGPSAGAPQTLGPASMPQQSAHMQAPQAPMPPPPPQGALPGVAPKAPPPMGPKPPRPGQDISSKAPPLRNAKHADVETPAEDKNEKPGDEEEEDTMMSAAKKVLTKGKDKKPAKAASKEKDD